jgi:hypothetical protein
VRIAAVHRFSSSKFLGGKSERQLIENRFSPYVPNAAIQHSPKLSYAEPRIFAFRFSEAAVRGLTRSAKCCH